MAEGAGGMAQTMASFLSSQRGVVGFVSFDEEGTVAEVGGQFEAEGLAQKLVPVLLELLTDASAAAAANDAADVPADEGAEPVDGGEAMFGAGPVAIDRISISIKGRNLSVLPLEGGQFLAVQVAEEQAAADE